MAVVRHMVMAILAQVAQVLGLPDADGQRAWLRIETAMGTIAQSIPPRSRGGIVATPNRIAGEAGVKILKAGGNASSASRRRPAS